MSDPADPAVDPSRRPGPRERRDPRLVALEQDSGYTIHERIGSGGMGIVYRGYDADGVPVAIKLLRHDISDDARARDRLAREVAAQRRLRSDNVVQIYDAELDSVDAFVVTEFIPGPTLEDAVEAHQGIHPEAVREIGLVLGETLQAIHARGVLHRDLKPSNVMLRGALEEDLVGFDPEGAGLDPVIIDFGIAMAAEESRLTSTGLVMGTASYLDPQVVRTNHSGEAGDWWALAAMLAFAATGRPPFGTGRADLVFLRAEKGELDVEGVPAQLAAWLRRALRPDPEDRPDPEELLSTLAELDLHAAAEEEPDQDAPGRDASEQDASDQDEDGQDAEPEDRWDRTELIPVTGRDDETRALPSGAIDRTEAIPLQEDVRRGDARRGGVRREDATQVLAQTDAEPRTEVLPPISEEPRTLVMPVVRDAPVRAPEPAPQAAPMQHQYPHQYPQQYPQPYAQPAPQQYTPAQVAPWQRPLVPRRPALVWTGHAVVIALGAVAPYMALAAIILLGALARTWDRSTRALEVRRARSTSGSGSAGTFAVGTAGPFRYLLALIEMVLQVILPLILGLLVGFAVDGIADLAGTILPDGVVFAIAIAVTLLLVWVGLGSKTTRNGTHRLMDAAAPDALWSAIVLGLLLLLLVAVIAAIVVRGGGVDYFPLGSWYRLEDLLPWRG